MLTKKQKKNPTLLKSAEHEYCTLQIAPWCTNNRVTSVACHLPSPDKGMGTKSPDFWIVYGCHACHDIIDGRKKVDLPLAEKWRILFYARYRTELRMMEKNVLSFIGMGEDDGNGNKSHTECKES